RDGLDRYMHKSCANSLEGVDCVIHLADTSRPIGEEEFRVVERLKHLTIPVILGLNKIDLKGEFLHQYISLWEDARKKKIDEIENLTMLPLSGKEGTQVEKLIDIIFSVLPDAPLFYDQEIVCDIPRKLVVADIIREKLFCLTREEVPHSIAVTVEEMRPVKGKTVRITANILVERDSQKEIIIGKGGQLVQKVGFRPGAELEARLESKVFRELYVKEQKNWRDDVTILADMGYQF
ncbi:MAG: GTPase Era, partial [Candidatus Omnitrophica bacterium]|nr:GTPase Era [Candidatus Omnitrophota bacterium]